MCGVAHSCSYVLLVFATGPLIIGIIVGIDRILRRAPVLRLCSKLGFARF